MVEMRQKLFLSYSRRDGDWRKRFIRHLAEQFSLGDKVWVDVQSIQGGSNWEESIRRGATSAKCALVLLTPNYLDCEGYARKELDLLLKEARNGLQLLPVLVEPCSWDTIEGLKQINLMRWTGSLGVGANTGRNRDQVVPLIEAEDETAKSSAIIDICKQVKANMGAAGAATLMQQNTLREATEKALQGLVKIHEPVRTGHFSVVFRGQLGVDTVAVKAIPAEVRQDRVRLLFDAALKAAGELSDPAFIGVRFYQTETEPHCLVMEYMDEEWPTLEHKLGECPEKRLSPLRVARILSTIARAQAVAHRSNLQLGPLSSANIYVNRKWDIKISPFRIEGQLGLATGLEDGQLLRWDLIAKIIPEVYCGRNILPHDYDVAEQYYLGLFGLELLLGHNPVEIRCFEHLERKRRFFANPHCFFIDPGAVEQPWTEENPALAFIMGRILAREPEGRYRTADEASSELAAAAANSLPDSVREEVEKDYEAVAKVEFADHFYQRLFHKRRKLRKRFRNIEEQHKQLVNTLVDLMAFNPKMKHDRFRDLADRHKQYGISATDVEAFRCAFLEQIEESFPANPAKRDAWNAVLKRGLEIIVQSS